MKKFLYLLLLVPMLMTNSCKKSTGGDDSGLSSITITALQDPVVYGIQDFTFRVRGNDGSPVTSSSTIYVDDNAIAGNTFEPTSAGTYTVYAKKGSLTSSPITVTATAIDLAIEATPNPTYIELDAFEFTATGSNGTNYTSLSTFYVNDSEITGHSYDPATAGDYEVYAKIGDVIVSPTIIATATVGYASLTTSVSESTIFVSQTVTFTAIDNLGRNLTSSATFYIDGTAITGNTYTATSAGNFDVYATYDAIQSNTDNFTAVSPSYTTKVLVEDYTGTWCGWCWYMGASIEDALNQSDDVVPTAIHNGDPMEYQYESSMTSEFGVGGYPAGRINRINNWNQSSQGNGVYYTFNQLQNYLDELVGLGLAVNSTLNGGSIDITIKVGYDFTYTNTLKLVVYLLEDDLVYTVSPQQKYYTDGTATESFPNYVHNHVLRKAYTDVFGDVIPSDDTEAGDVYTRNFTVSIPTDVQDNNNLSIVAFVVDGATKEVINVQKADIGVNQDFD